jgi:phosphatidylserine/phosphatidylglycerophosphate/cardiolipin synthase-like enzyme
MTGKTVRNIHPLEFIDSSSLSLSSTSAAVVVAPVSAQPLECVLSSTSVEVVEGRQGEETIEIRKSIQSLDALVDNLSNVKASRLGISPGFDTVESAEIWRTLDAFPEYQTLDSVNFIPGAIPLPCTEIAMKYFLRIKDVWRERLDWAATKEEVCSCIGEWQHRQTMNILQCLSNQMIEQLMVQEASNCLRNQPNLGHIWSECYTPEKCPSPDEMSSLYLDSSVHLLGNLEDYIYSYVDCALKSRHTIDISICYLFHIDPAARYILLDLIPFVAARGVKVRILFESMTVESQTLRGAFQAVQSRPDCTCCGGQFDYNLPKGSPPFQRGQNELRCASHLIREVLDIASSSPNIDCRFWFARDERCKYRIKNHIKCHVFDGKYNGRVIAGGSNVAPRPAQLDTDFIVEGGVSGLYLQHFDSMWEAMSARSGAIHAVSAEEKKEVDEILPLDNVFSTEETYQRYGMSSKILFLPSVPSSLGEDVILRCVLGGIKRANESIFICMGHCNVPEVVSEALKEATERGVKVEILTNSLYTCDLRNGQRDLFKSLQRMLQIAPMVDLVSAMRIHYLSVSYVQGQPVLFFMLLIFPQYVTAVKEGSIEGPPFLHSKYVVVDSEWVAVGSWNMWTRSAFYEMEAEIFVSSSSFAADLQKKFERERNEYTVQVKTVKGCEKYLPSGCSICTHFGPFFEIQAPSSRRSIFSVS